MIASWIQKHGVSWGFPFLKIAFTGAPLRFGKCVCPTVVFRIPLVVFRILLVVGCGLTVVLQAYNRAFLFYVRTTVAFLTRGLRNAVYDEHRKVGSARRKTIPSLSRKDLPKFCLVNDRVGGNSGVCGFDPSESRALGHTRTGWRG